jgi:hypothetical protein
MNKNMGALDRIVRLAVAAAIAILYATGSLSGTLGIVLAVVAVILVVTSAVGFCPLYAPLGISTRGKKAA